MAERIDDLIDPRAFQQLEKLLNDLNMATADMERLTKSAADASTQISKLGSLKGVSDAAKDIEASSKAMETATDRVTDSARKAKKAEDDLVKSTQERIRVSNTELAAINKVGTGLDNYIRLQVRLKAELSQNTKEQRALAKELQNGNISTEKYTRSVADLVARQNDLKAAQRQVNAVTKATIREQNAAEGSSEQLSARLVRLRREWDNLSQEQREAANSGQALQAEINQLDEAVKDLDESTGRNQRNVGNYRSAFEGLPGPIGNVIKGFGDLAEGADDFSDNIEGSGAGIQGFIAGLKSMARASLAFIATPLGATLAGIAVTLGGVKAWFDYNKSIAEATRLTRQLTGATGDELKNLRADIQATADTFDQEYQQTLIAVNATAKQFGISHQEALDVVNKGFIAGADASGEFLDQLREYPSQLKAVGLSAEETTAIITQSTQEGIYSDKGIDAIKEAGLRIREMTQPTKDAFEAIGLSSAEIQRGLTDGSQTMFDVIQQVSERLRGLEDNSVEVGMAMADIFGGAGEDAGLQYLRTLADIDTNLDNLVEKQGEAQQKQLQAAQELNRVWAALFDQTGGVFENLIADAKLFGTQVLVQVINSVVTLINYFIDLFNESVAFRAYIFSLKATVETAFDAIEFAIRRVVSAISDIGAVIRAILTGDISAIGDAISNAFTNQVEEYKRFGKDVAQNYVDGVNDTIRGAKIERIDISGGGSGTQFGGGSFGGGGAGGSFAGSGGGSGTVTNRRVEAEIAGVKRILEANKAAGLETQDAEKKLTDFIKRQADIRADAKIAAEERAFEQEQEVNEARKELINEVAGLATDLVSARFDRELDTLERQSEQLDINKEKDIQRIQESTASEEEKAERIKQIELQAQARQEQIVERQKQVELEQAKFRRLASIAGVIQNTAQGVTAALTSIPPNVPLSIIIGAIGAAQLGRIVSQPLPAFATGTDNAPEGPAVVGEKGRELRIDPDGKMSLTGNKAELTWLKKGTQIVPNFETEKMLAGASLSGMGSIVNYNSGGNIDEDKLAKKIGKEFKKNAPKNGSTHITKGGMKYMYKNGSSYREYLKRNRI